MANILTINLKAEADSASALDAFAQKLATQLGINHPCVASQIETCINDLKSQQGDERGYWWEEMSAWIEGVAWISPTSLQLDLSSRDPNLFGEWADEVLLHFPTITLCGTLYDTTNLVSFDIFTLTHDDDSRELALGDGEDMDIEPDC